ncbi:MAG: 16S rRNA (adenine(1518)-N(6)/adenine(1519)-N(6))-dimethyltransferase RsmA [Pseudomonadota bacterium]
MAHRPRKRFGQHFLHDAGVVQRILAAIAPGADDHCIEIGPGEGVLTTMLLPACGRLDAVELDRDLVQHLQQRFGGNPRFHLHNADALAFDFCRLADNDTPLRVTGNLPYNISTPLLFHLLDQSRCIADMHFMLQKEVVERMAAGPGSKTYGRLSVAIQAFCAVTSLFDIGPGAFRPPPRVQSSVVRLVPYAQPPYLVADRTLFDQVLKRAFGQRRKTLRNSLRDIISSNSLRALGIDPGLRPEQLSVAQFVDIANALGDNH